MVKLGNNFSEKNGGKAVSEDGFDTIPLITPLDASQLQFPPPDKVRFTCLPFNWKAAAATAFVSAVLLSYFYSNEKKTNKKKPHTQQKQCKCNPSPRPLPTWS